VGKHSACAMKCSDRMDGKSLWLCQEASEPLGLSKVGRAALVSSMPLQGSRETRGKLPRRCAWLKDRLVRAHEADVNLRGKPPRSQDLA
jgi:hypothetical protein